MLHTSAFRTIWSKTTEKHLEGNTNINMGNVPKDPSLQPRKVIKTRAFWYHYCQSSSYQEPQPSTTPGVAFLRLLRAKPAKRVGVKQLA